MKPLRSSRIKRHYYFGWSADGRKGAWGASVLCCGCGTYACEADRRVQDLHGYPGGQRECVFAPLHAVSQVASYRKSGGLHDA